MDNITRYNLKTILVPALLVVLLLIVLGYAVAPATATFDWNSLNPVEAVGTLAFALGFGVGLPDILAVSLIVLLLFLLWGILFWLVRRDVR